MAKAPLAFNLYWRTDNKALFRDLKQLPRGRRIRAADASRSRAFKVLNVIHRNLKFDSKSNGSESHKACDSLFSQRLGWCILTSTNEGNYSKDIPCSRPTVGTFENKSLDDRKGKIMNKLFVSSQRQIRIIYCGSLHSNQPTGCVHTAGKRCPHPTFVPISDPVWTTQIRFVSKSEPDQRDLRSATHPMFRNRTSVWPVMLCFSQLLRNWNATQQDLCLLP